MGNKEPILGLCSKPLDISGALLPIKDGLDTFQGQAGVCSRWLGSVGLNKGVALMCIVGSIWGSHMLCTMGSSCVVSSMGCAACSADTPNIHAKGRMNRRCILQGERRYLASFMVNIGH